MKSQRSDGCGSHVHGRDHGAVRVQQNHDVTDALPHRIRQRQCAHTVKLGHPCLRILEPMIDTRGFIESNVSILKTIVTDSRTSKNLFENDAGGITLLMSCGGAT